MQCTSMVHVNQDKHGWLRMIDAGGKPITLALVADGISLGFEGKYASYNTVKCLMEWAAEYFMSTPFDAQSAAEEISALLADCNHRLNEFSEMNSDKDTCCTVCGMITDESQTLIFNAGDSRVYELSSDRGVRCMTQDDIAEDGYSIAMHIGGKEDDGITVSFSQERFRADGSYLICTDGMYRRLRFEEWLTELCDVADSEAAVELLRDMTEQLRADGETDDITGIILAGSKANG